MAVATLTPEAPILSVQKAFKDAFISSSIREEGHNLHHTNYFQLGQFIRGTFLKPTIIFQLGFLMYTGPGKLNILSNNSPAYTGKTNAKSKYCSSC